MSDDISHNEAMTTIKVICEITNQPFAFAKGDYDDRRSEGKSRLEAVATIVEWLIAENTQLVTNIIAIRKNYMEG